MEQKAHEVVVRDNLKKGLKFFEKKSKPNGHIARPLLQAFKRNNNADLCNK